MFQPVTPHTARADLAAPLLPEGAALGPSLTQMPQTADVASAQPRRSSRSSERFWDFMGDLGKVFGAIGLCIAVGAAIYYLR